MCPRKAQNTEFESNLERFQKWDSYCESQFAIGWTEILGPTRKGRQVLRGLQKRTIKIREPLEVVYQSRGTSFTGGQKGRLLGGREPLIADLPHSTEAIPRMSSRTTVEVVHVVASSSSHRHLVDLFNVGGWLGTDSSKLG